MFPAPSLAWQHHAQAEDPKQVAVHLPPSHLQRLRKIWMILKCQLYNLGHNFTSLDPRTQVAITLVFVGYLTRSSSSSVIIEPRPIFCIVFGISFLVRITCHDCGRVSDQNMSDVRTVTHWLSAVTDEHTLIGMFLDPVCCAYFMPRI